MQTKTLTYNPRTWLAIEVGEAVCAPGKVGTLVLPPEVGGFDEIVGA